MCVGVNDNRNKKMATLKKYESIIRNALEQTKTYYSGLDMQISSLATALKTLELATDEIGKLKSVTVLETTRYGEKLAPHPAFKIQKDAQDSVTRQMKALGLIAESGADSAEEPTLLEQLWAKQGKFVEKSKKKK